MNLFVTHSCFKERVQITINFWKIILGEMLYKYNIYYYVCNKSIRINALLNVIFTNQSSTTRSDFVSQNINIYKSKLNIEHTECQILLNNTGPSSKIDKKFFWPVQVHYLFFGLLKSKSEHRFDIRWWRIWKQETMVRRSVRLIDIAGHLRLFLYELV